MYQEKLREMNRFALFGLALAAAFVVIFFVSTPFDIDNLDNITVTARDVILLLGSLLGFLLLASLVFIGVPYVWKLLGEILPLSQAGTLIFWIVIFLLRLFISMGFSWIIFPIIYLYTYIQSKREKNNFKVSRNTENP